MHVSRAGNILADALTNLSSTFDFPVEASTKMIIFQKMEEPSIHYHDSLFRELKELDERKQVIAERMGSTEILIIEVQEEIEDDKPWYYDLKNFLDDQSFLEFATSEDKKKIRRFVVKYTTLGGLVYQKSFDDILLRCLDDHETWTIIEKAHSRVCGGHVNG